MKIIFVNTPYQGDTTLNPQIIDGEAKCWCVKSEMLNIDETFQQFLKRKKEKWDSKGVKGMYFYDIQPVGDIVGLPKKSAMIIRYELNSK